jgi:hypothetical protein
MLAQPPAKKTADLIEKETEKKSNFQSKLPSLYLLETTVFNHQIGCKTHMRCTLNQ